MRSEGKLSWSDVLRLSSWEMAKLAPFFVIGYFIYSIFLPYFTFVKIAKYDVDLFDPYSLNEKELRQLEKDEALLGKLDLNGNGKIDGIGIQSFDTDVSGSFSEDEIKILQADNAVRGIVDENNNTKIDEEEIVRAEEFLAEINNANGYLSWNWKIDGAVLLAFFLIMFGIAAKYSYSFKTLKNRDVFLEKFPKFIGLKPISLYVIAFGFAASIIIFFRGEIVLFVLVLSTTFLFIFAFLRGLKAETIRSGRQPRGKASDGNTDATQVEIRTLKWHFPSIPGDKYEGKAMDASYGVSAPRFEAFQRKNRRNFQGNANNAPSVNSWPRIYIANRYLSQETRELADELYKLVNQYGLSEYQQVELVLAAVQSITYEKDEVSAPEMKNLRTDLAEAVERPAKDKLAVLAYLYLKVSVTGANTDGQVGFTDDEKEIVNTYLRDWFDEWNSEKRIGINYSEVESYIYDVTEYVKAENLGKGDGDAEERFYKPAIESFTLAQHERILDEMREVMIAEESEGDDVKRSYQLGIIDYMETRFIDYSESKGEYKTIKPEEYPRYPTETLYEQKGDCEDTAMLLAALLRECRFEVQLLELESDEIDPKTKQNIRHMACGVKIEGSDSFDEFQTHKIHGYVYCEPTDAQWRVGQMPPGLRVINRLDVEPLPEGAK